METGHSDTVTEGIRVRVGAQLAADQSDPDRRLWVYAYRVVLSNEGAEPAKLLARHWIIRDSHNQVREVRGPGVVGEHPDLEPGQSFEYLSSCPLGTEWGTMEGSYQMERRDGRRFEARIGRFYLARSAAPLAHLDPAPDTTASRPAQRAKAR
jgi:ApaG protein